MHAVTRKRQNLRLTRAQGIARVECIQPLWNNYGTLSRVVLQGGEQASVIVKHIQIPGELGHPRGFASDISRDRKIRSYAVETHWYQTQNASVPAKAPTPRCLDAFSEAGELFLLLEDLSTRGLNHVLYAVSWDEITVVLGWLASFHARFLGDAGEGLWPSGTYWHLDTHVLRNSPTSWARGCTTSRDCWTHGCDAVSTRRWFTATRSSPTSSSARTTLRWVRWTSNTLAAEPP